MSSRETEILLAVQRGGPESLQAQIERQFRDAVRTGALRPGVAVPSTRDLARDLGVSRPLVMEAYSQLAAEGYLALRQGAAPRVSTLVRQPPMALAPDAALVEEQPRILFRTGTPDLVSFPRASWVKATGAALRQMGGEDFGYTQRYGASVLRQALADYLGRVRGVSADPRQILIVGGFEQARSFLARALWQTGARRIAIEDPGYIERGVFADAGFTLLPVPVDDNGIIVEQLAATGADTVLLTPAHQYPAGVVLSGARRLQLVAWLRAHDAIAIEDDYDAEFRFDRAPVGALQGLDPERVVYVGTASKTLAPALRLGWMVVPPSLLGVLQDQQRANDNGRSRIEQHVFAEFIRSGEFDRHLRRMRGVYKERRRALLEILGEEMPEALVGGISAGLHATVALPHAVDEPAVQERALRRGVGFDFMSQHFMHKAARPSTLLLGYSRLQESEIRTGVRVIAAALRET